MQSNQSNAPTPVNAYGSTTGTVSTGPLTTVLSIKDPTTYDFNYPIKQRWINTTSESEFILIGFSNVTGKTLATWIPLGSGESIETITGNSGGAIGPDSSHNINLITSNSTPKILGSGHSLTLDFGLINLLLGSNGSITTGGENTGYGLAALAATTTGGSNCAFGTDSLLSNVGGSTNSAFGQGSLSLFNPGSSATFTRNCAFGNNSLDSLLTGTDNIAVGNLSGSSYTSSESSNISIGNTGTVSESNVIRIGTQGSSSGQQNKALMAGITGVTAVGSPMAISSTGQMSDLGFGTTSQVLTSNGAGVSPTWQNFYSQGTFTPVLSFGGSSTGITYSSRSGNYTTIGNLVFINLVFVLSNKGSSTGQAVVSGLPFTIFVDNDFFLNTSIANILSNTFTYLGIGPSGGSKINLNYSVTGSPQTGSNMDDTFFNNTTQLRLFGFYQSS